MDILWKYNIFPTGNRRFWGCLKTSQVRGVDYTTKGRGLEDCSQRQKVVKSRTQWMLGKNEGHDLVVSWDLSINYGWLVISQ